MYKSTLTLFFFFNDTATTEIYTLSLHDALPILHAVEGADAAVGPGELGGDQTGGDVAHAGAAVALDGAAGDAELGELGHQLEGELGALPVVVDPRGDLLLAEGAHAVADLDLLRLEEFLQVVEVRARLAHVTDATTGPAHPPGRDARRSSTHAEPHDLEVVRLGVRRRSVRRRREGVVRRGRARCGPRDWESAVSGKSVDLGGR